MLNMKLAILALAAAALPITWADGSNSDAAREVLALERQALDGWLAGSPDPQLAICDPAITYIHDVVGKRLDGIEALQQLYERYRGIPLFDRYEMLDPEVRTIGPAAVLTYQLARHKGPVVTYWNATQIYERKPEGWRVIHSHWSAGQRF